MAEKKMVNDGERLIKRLDSWYVWSLRVFCMLFGSLFMTIMYDDRTKTLRAVQSMALRLVRLDEFYPIETDVITLMNDYLMLAILPVAAVIVAILVSLGRLKILSEIGRLDVSTGIDTCIACTGDFIVTFALVGLFWGIMYAILWAPYLNYATGLCTIVSVLFIYLCIYKIRKIEKKLKDIYKQC